MGWTFKQELLTAKRHLYTGATIVSKIPTCHRHTVGTQLNRIKMSKTIIIGMNNKFSVKANRWLFSLTGLLFFTNGISYLQ